MMSVRPVDVPRQRQAGNNRLPHPLATVARSPWPAGHQDLHHVYADTMEAVRGLRDHLTARSSGRMGVSYMIRRTQGLHARLKRLWVYLLELSDVDEPEWRAARLVDVMRARHKVSVELAEGLTLAVGWQGRVLDSTPILARARRRLERDRREIAARLQADEQRLLRMAERMLTGAFLSTDLALDIVGRVRAAYPVWRRLLVDSEGADLPRPDAVRAVTLLEVACRRRA